jgi:hypothetical protein
VKGVMWLVHVCPYQQGKSLMSRAAPRARTRMNAAFHATYRYGFSCCWRDHASARRWSAHVKEVQKVKEPHSFCDKFGTIESRSMIVDVGHMFLDCEYVS